MLLGGHSSDFYVRMLQYSLLHLVGSSGVFLDDTKLFQVWGSKLLVTLEFRHREH